MKEERARAIYARVKSPCDEAHKKRENANRYREREMRRDALLSSSSSATTTTSKKRKKKPIFALVLRFGLVGVALIWTTLAFRVARMNDDDGSSESSNGRRRSSTTMLTLKKGENEKNHLPSYDRLFGDAEKDVSLREFSSTDKKVLEYERRRIYASETKIMRQDEMKARNLKTGKWKMLSKPRALNETEMRGYVDHIESEEARVKGVLKTLRGMRCESESACEKVVEELVLKTIDGFKKSEKLFVDHEVVSSINLSNRAFGSRNAEKAILTLSGDREQLKMLGLDEEKMYGFREKGRKRGGAKKRKECAVVGNGPIRREENNRGSNKRGGEEEDIDENEESVVANTNNNDDDDDINSVGRTIDSHDVVFRVNQGPTGGRYEEKVGTKTDFRVLNNAWAEKYGQESALGKKLREAVETDETVISTRASAERFYELAKQFQKEGGKRSSSHPPWMASDRVQSDVRKLLEKVRAVKTRIVVMRENGLEEGDQEHEDKKHVIMHGGTTPSTGILAIFLALASGCDTVDPYGFSYGRGGRFSSGNSMKTYHYFTDKESFHNPTHSYALEGEILRVVKRLGF